MNYKKYKNDEGICNRVEYFSSQRSKILAFLNEGKLSLARKVILDILNQYPEEETFLKILANICIKEKDYLGAIEILKCLDEEENRVLLTSLYIKVNDQREMENFYQKYYSDELFSDQDVHEYDDSQFLDYQLCLYLKKIFDFSLNLDWGKLVYLCRQIYSYDNRWAVGHIETHHQNKKEINKGVFDSSILIYSLFYQVQNYINLNQDKGIFDSRISDYYCFYYPNCGKNHKGKDTNYFEVVTLVNSPNIITMYPISSQVSEYRDICYLDDVNFKRFVKVRNGLERFQDRYKKQ